MNPSLKKEIRTFKLLKFSAFLVLFGRAYQFLFFGAPFRAILWDESLFAPIVEFIFNISWYEYATSAIVNQRIELFTKISGFVLFLSGIIVLVWDRINSSFFKRLLLGLGIFILLLMGVCMVKDKNFDILQLFELSLQIAAPIAIFCLKSSRDLVQFKWISYFKIAIALTFTSHGLFALGLIYVPGHFIDMTISILGVTESTARTLLLLIGILDILASILLFLPKVYRFALWYTIIWGLLSAFARTLSGLNLELSSDWFHHYLYLTLYRLPHGILPLITLYLTTLIHNRDSKVNEE